MLPGSDYIGGAAIQKVYEALDKLAGAVAQLPVKDIQHRPSLYQAQMQALKVIDEGVKEGNYVVPRGND